MDHSAEVLKIAVCGLAKHFTDVHHCEPAGTELREYSTQVGKLLL